MTGHLIPLSADKIWCLILAAMLSLGGVAMKGNPDEARTDAPALHPSSAQGYDRTRSQWVAATPQNQPNASSPASARLHPGETASTGGHTWSDASTRFGLSFGIAVIIGVMLRAFVRTMTTILALLSVGTLALAHFGIIDPFWQQPGFSLSGLGSWISSQTETLRQFLTGHLPSAGAATLGFGYGLKR